MNMPERHYIIGYLGAQTRKEGEALARLLQCPLLFVDDEIERLDGRSIKRICMINGEHAYRNKEFEILSKLDDPAYDLGLAKNEVYPDRLVVVCGDGAVLDEMSLEILSRAHTVFIDEDVDALWVRANAENTAPYAFMYDSEPDAREKLFREKYKLRLPLYNAAASEILQNKPKKERAGKD